MYGAQIRHFQLIRTSIKCFARVSRVHPTIIHYTYGHVRCSPFGAHIKFYCHSVQCLIIIMEAIHDRNVCLCPFAPVVRLRSHTNRANEWNGMMHHNIDWAQHKTITTITHSYRHMNVHATHVSIRRPREREMKQRGGGGRERGGRNDQHKPQSFSVFSNQPNDRCMNEWTSVCSARIRPIKMSVWMWVCAVDYACEHMK